MGVGRDRRGNFQRLDGLSTTFCMASEHAFLEDIGRPSVRLFVDNVVCDVYNCLLGQSYACRALLPCIERTDTERDSAVRNVHSRHPAHPARSALAVLASFGAIHVPPDAHHDTFVRDARSNGTAVGPLDAAALQLDWNQTHPTPDIAHMFDCAPPRLLRRLNIWIENPGAGALFRWLYPRLREIYGIDLRNATHVARLTHCCGGGAGWRKYTQILSTDPGLRHRIGVCGPSPALNCGHAKRHEITFAGNTALPDDAMGIKHSIPPRLYDALVAPLAAVIPPSDRHLYLIVHLGSGSQSSRHLCARGFPVAFVDYERSVTNNFRTVRPTVITDYDSYASITEVVALAARRAGFHPDAVVGVLFDPCCVTRTPMTNMNRKHRYPSGQPLPSPDGDEAQTRDDRDAYHIADLDQLSVRRDILIADRLNKRSPLPDSLPDDDGNDDNPVDEEAGTLEGAVDLTTADSNASSSASTDLAHTADLADTFASRTTGFTSADACQTASATHAATNLVCATDPGVGSVTSGGDGASEHNTGDDDGDAESVARSDDGGDGSEDSADGAVDGGGDDGDEDGTHDDSDAGNSNDDESDDDDNEEGRRRRRRRDDDDDDDGSDGESDTDNDDDSDDGLDDDESGEGSEDVGGNGGDDDDGDRDEPPPVGDDAESEDEPPTVDDDDGSEDDDGCATGGTNDDSTDLPGSAAPECPTPSSFCGVFYKGPGSHTDGGGNGATNDDDDSASDGAVAQRQPVTVHRRRRRISDSDNDDDSDNGGAHNHAVSTSVASVAFLAQPIHSAPATESGEGSEDVGGDGGIINNDNNGADAPDTESGEGSEDVGGDGGTIDDDNNDDEAAVRGDDDDSTDEWRSCPVSARYRPPPTPPDL